MKNKIFGSFWLFFYLLAHRVAEGLNMAAIVVVKITPVGNPHLKKAKSAYLKRLNQFQVTVQNKAYPNWHCIRRTPQ